MTYETDNVDEIEGRDGAVQQPVSEDASQPDLQEQLNAARQEIDQLKDKYLRSLAELDNYRKRVMREREQQEQRSRMELIRQLLPVVDDFGLALSHVPGDYAGLPWIEGITLIHRKLSAFLSNFGVVPIEAIGQPFDPRYHDALMREASDQHPEGIVTAEVRKGYMMGDQVLRPTMVTVSMGPATD